MNKSFSVSALKSLGRTQSYVIVLDFERNTVKFHKVKRGKQVCRSFAFHTCVKLEKLTKQNELIVIFTGPEYKKHFAFASAEDRDVFCQLVHAVIVSGNRAYKLYKSLQTSRAASHQTTDTTSPIIAKQQLSLSDSGNGNGNGTQNRGENSTNDMATPPPSSPDDSTTTSAASNLSSNSNDSASNPAETMDFVRFLLSFSSAQTQLDHSAINNSSPMIGGPSPSVFPTSPAIAPDDYGKTITRGTHEPSVFSLTTSSTSRLPLSPSSPSSSNSGASSLVNSPAVVPHHSRSTTGQVELISAYMNQSSAKEGSVIDASVSTAEMFGFELLPGELLVIQQRQTSRLNIEESVNAGIEKKDEGGSVNAMITRTTSSRGALLLTNFRLIYRDYQSRDLSSPSSFPHSHLNSTTTTDLEIPLACISRLIRSSTAPTVHLKLVCKDGRKVEFTFDASLSWVEGFMKQMQRMAFPKETKELFAFQYRLPPPLASLSLTANSPIINGWSLYSSLQDYERIGLLTHPSYRLISLNADYSLCPSYPPHFILPASISDEDVRYIAKYRSQGRLPAVVYLHPVTGASLSRCAQPLSGLKGKRSDPDEKLLQLLKEGSEVNKEVLYIIDARPKKAAVGNSVMGKGYENVSHYDNCVLQFMNIDNIHSIRGSLEKLTDLLEDRRVEDSVWLSKLENTQWLHYVGLVLNAAVRCAMLLSEDGCSVVTHCSDGWDRTSQICSLTELMLDPHYRTLTGFAQLIEKEWLSFGHQFAVRLGHAAEDYANEQRAPIFLQFLDCVWQMIRQFPTSFQFNEEWLIAIADGALSCQYGTFLYDSDRERKREELDKKTVSIWTVLLSNEERGKYINEKFVPAVGMSGKTNKNAVDYCIPNVNARRIVLWEAMHCRYLRDEYRSNKPKPSAKQQQEQQQARFQAVSTLSPLLEASSSPSSSSSDAEMSLLRSRLDLVRSTIVEVGLDLSKFDTMIQSLEREATAAKMEMTKRKTVAEGETERERAIPLVNPSSSSSPSSSSTRSALSQTALLPRSDSGQETGSSASKPKATSEVAALDEVDNGGRGSILEWQMNQMDTHHPSNAMDGSLFPLPLSVTSSVNIAIAAKATIQPALLTAARGSLKSSTSSSSSSSDTSSSPSSATSFRIHSTTSSSHLADPAFALAELRRIEQQQKGRRERTSITVSASEAEAKIAIVKMQLQVQQQAAQLAMLQKQQREQLLMQRQKQQQQQNNARRSSANKRNPMHYSTLQLPGGLSPTSSDSSSRLSFIPPPPSTLRDSFIPLPPSTLRDSFIPANMQYDEESSSDDDEEDDDNSDDDSDEQTEVVAAPINEAGAPAIPATSKPNMKTVGTSTNSASGKAPLSDLSSVPSSSPSALFPSPDSSHLLAAAHDEDGQLLVTRSGAPIPNYFFNRKKLQDLDSNAPSSPSPPKSPANSSLKPLSPRQSPPQSPVHSSPKSGSKSPQSALKLNVNPGKGGGGESEPITPLSANASGKRFGKSSGGNETPSESGSGSGSGSGNGDSAGSGGNSVSGTRMLSPKKAVQFDFKVVNDLPSPRAHADGPGLPVKLRKGQSSPRLLN